MRRLMVGFALVLLADTALPQTSKTKFSVYETPYPVTAMDWALLQTNLKLLTNIDNRNTDQVEIPRLYFDRRLQKMRASVRVTRNTAKSSPESLRELLSERALTAKVEAQQWVAEATDSDFEIVFYYLDWKSSPGVFAAKRVEFAFFRNGELTFR